MIIKVFEVVQICMLDSFSHGLFVSKEKAIKKAEAIAEQQKYTKQNDLQWGLLDLYGMVDGIQILEKEIQ